MFILENISVEGFNSITTKIISIISVISGILVIVNKNPVKSVLFLIGLFLTIALYLFTLNISFIALAYLLVYVGAVSILFLFILMLINVRVSELTTDNNNSIPLSLIIIIIFSFTFSSKLEGNNEKSAFQTYFYDIKKTLKTEINNGNTTITESESIINNQPLIESLFFIKKTNEKVSLVFSSTWDSILAEMSHISSLGNVIYVSYSLGILIVGLILLLAMIGAISVTAKSNTIN